MLEAKRAEQFSLMRVKCQRIERQRYQGGEAGNQAFFGGQWSAKRSDYEQQEWI